MYAVRPLSTPLGPLGTSLPPFSGEGADEEVTSGIVELEFGSGDVDLRKVSAGDLVWRTKDASLEQRVLSGCAIWVPSVYPPPTLLTAPGRVQSQRATQRNTRCVRAFRRDRVTKPSEASRRRVPVSARLLGGLGQALRIELSTLQEGPGGERLHSAAETAGPFVPAQSRPMDAQAVIQAIGACPSQTLLPPPGEGGTLWRGFLLDAAES